MPFVITAATLKGGVGKTTTSVAIADAASVGDNPAVLVDSDPMGSAVRWSVLAAEGGQPLRAEVVGVPAQDLKRRLGRVAHGAAVVVIDAPPPGNLAVGRAAIEAADVVVMPCPPNFADLDRVPATLAEAVKFGVPAYAVLVKVQGGVGGRGDRDRAAEALAAWGVTVLETQLPLAAAVQRNYGQAPRGILARFGVDLMTEILDVTKGEGRRRD